MVTIVKLLVFARIVDDCPGYFQSCVPVLPSQYLRALAFQILVDREKVLDLAKNVLLDFGVSGDSAETWIARCVRQDFFIRNALVKHLEESYGADMIDAAWEGRRVAQDQDVEGISILRQGLRDEAVITWVMNWRV